MVNKKLQMPFEKAMPEQEEAKFENQIKSLSLPTDELNIMQPKNADD